MSLSLDEIADNFINELRRGNNPSVSGYAKQYPELSEEIEELFPALKILEHGGRQKSLSNFSKYGTKPEEPSSVPVQIANYKILREIARGGMGIVYEAWDDRLKRRVALKILKVFRGEEEQSASRFEREARMAARLHHSNSVPVYDSGVFEGKFFYVMQYIDGISIDKVLTEMNRIRKVALDKKPDSGARLTPVPFQPENESHWQVPYQDAKEDDDLDQPENDDHLDSAVHSLQEEPVPKNTNPDFDPDFDLNTNPDFDSNSDQPSNFEDEAAGSSSPENPTNTMPLSHMPRTTFGRIFTDPRDPAVFSQRDVNATFEALREDPHLKPFKSLYQFVAQVGIQVALALDCAQSHDIIHRDIKPSNLMLDKEGTIRVTDFGLSKPMAENDLTQDGQIIGTLRYMAPEGLDGKFSPQSDIYSLGLTLYELLTLSPAFGETNYSRLFGQVSESHICRPRKLDPKIPRDLETIVLKATAKEPKHRYQRGAELADDLTRFLEDRPILARRITWMEQVWRWAKHRKATATFIVTTIFLFFMLFASVTVGFFHNRMLLEEKRQETIRAQKNLNLALAAFENIFSAFQGSNENMPFPRETGTFDVSLAEPIITEKEANVLESLLKFYGQFAQENKGNRKLLMEMFRAYSNIGMIRQQLGRSRNAIEAYEASFGYYHQTLQMIDSVERRQKCQLEMADIVNNYLVSSSTPSFANSFLLQVVNELIDDLNQFPPDTPLHAEANENLYNLFHYRATLRLQNYLETLLKNREPEQDETVIDILFQSLQYDDKTVSLIKSDFIQSRQILTILLQEKPNSDEFQTAMARNNGTLMVLALIEKKKDEAAKLQDEAFQIISDLRKRSPNDLRFRMMEADALMMSTCLYLIDPAGVNTPGKTTEEYQIEGIGFREKALDIINELQKEYPQTPQFAIRSILGKYGLAMAWQKAGNSDRTIRYFEECINDFHLFHLKYPYYNDFQCCPVFFYRYAQFLVKQKKYDRAESLIQEALESIEKERTNGNPPNERIEKWFEPLNKLRRQLPHESQ